MHKDKSIDGPSKDVEGIRALTGLPPARDVTEIAFAMTGRLAHLFPRWFNDNIKNDWGLTGPSLTVIGLLNRAGEMTMGQAAAALDLTAGAMTRIVKVAERAGLVTRIVDPDDRRKTRISLTATAIEKAQRLHPTYEQLVKPMFSDLSAEDIAGYIRVATKLANGMRGTDPQDQG